MILKIVASVSKTISSYHITYDSGRTKVYTHNDKLPNNVVQFMEDHEPIQKMYPYWTKYTYIYTNKKGGY